MTNPLSPILSGALRLYPFQNGSGRIIDKMLHDVTLGTEPVATKTIHGATMTVRPDDLIGRHILLSGRFDDCIYQLVNAFIEDGDMVFDVGANIGYISTSILATRKCRVTAFEPNPPTYDLLKSNLAHWPQERRDSFALGLSSQADELFFALDKDNVGGSRIVETEVEADITIPCRDLDSFLEETGLPAPAVMKVDVEGHEAAVFEGARRTLKTSPPRAIIFEDEKSESGPDGAIGNRLIENGYRIYGLKKLLVRSALIPVDASNAGEFHDLLALHETASLTERFQRRFLMENGA